MAITKRQIELEVRANNLSNKSMDEVIRNINDLSEALEVQAKLAEQGQGSVDDLTKTYDKLSKAGNALVSQTGVIESMGLLAQAVEKAQERVAKTTKTLDEYKVSIAGIAKLTGEQSSQLAKLEKAAAAAGKSFDAQNKKFTKATENAERIGVNMDNLAQANDRVAESAKRLNAIQTKVTDNLDAYGKQITKVTNEQDALAASDLSLAKAREARAAAEAKFNAERAASATKFREADYSKMFDELEAREVRAKNAIEAADRAQRELAAVEKSNAAARVGETADRAKFDAESAANLRKFKEADYARMFDELARAEEHAAKETADLERELKKLGTTTDKATDKQKALAKASVDAAKKADDAGVASKGLLNSIGQMQKNLIGGERTSLGFFQRMRGEILSLIAAYAGFQGAIDTARGALQAFRNEQATQVKLLVATGNDAGAAAGEYAYLRGQAERLGVAFEDLSTNYASFRIAAKDANLTVQDTRFIFESISEAGVKLNLTRDNIKGIQKALEQLVSKGTASSEELQEQLGDRLPGVMQVAAKKMGFAGETAVADFRKALADGKVDAVRAAAALARGMNEQFEVVDVSKSLTGTEGRFQTALADWKRTIAESGLVEAYAELLKKITEVMKSAEGKDLASAIGKSFGAVTNAIIYLIDNMETVKVILVELGALFSAFVAIRFAGWVFGVAESIVALTNIVKFGAIPALVALNALLLAITLIPIAVWAYNNFEPFKKLIDESAMGWRALWEVIKVGLKTVANGAASLFNFLTSGIRNALAAVLETFAKAARAVGKNGLAAEVEATAAALRQGLGDKTFIDKLNADIIIAKRELASLQRLTGKGGFHAKPTEGGVINPITGLPLEPKKKVAPTKTQETGLIGTGLRGAKDAGKKEAEQYANLLKSLTNQVAAVTASAQKKDKENLATHIAGIEKQYEGLFNEIGRLKSKEAATLTKNLRDAVDSLTNKATKDYWQKQVDGLDAVKKKFAEMDVQLGKGGGEAGRAQIVAGIAEQFAQIRKEIDGLDLEQLGGAVRKLELLSTLDASERQTRERAVNKDLFREAQEQGKALDNLITTRTQNIEAFQTQVARGELTTGEMFTKTADAIAEVQPAIESAAKSAIAFAEALRGKEGIDPAALDAYILSLQQVPNSFKDIQTEIYSTKDLMDDLSDVGVGTMDSFAKNVAESALGLQSWSDGIKQVGIDFAKMAGDMLMNIAKIIAQEQLLGLVRAGLKAVGGVSVGVNHEGGVIGSTGRSRTVSAGWFANAPKYHTGGIAGLAPNEYPAILKKNEEVLTENDPRNILNGNTGGGVQQAPMTQEVKVVNMIDSGSFVSEGLSTASGTKAVMNFMRANSTQLKTILR